MNIKVQSPALSEYQRAILSSGKRFTVTEASTKSGKSQPLDCIVKTPFGDVKIRNLKIGDQIFAPDGTIATVEYIYPKGLQPTYKIIFNDKTSTECSLDHLWLITHYKYGKGERKRKDCKHWPMILSTDQLLKISKNELRFYGVPLTKSLNYIHRDILIDPYLLGVLIGDGSTTSGIMIASSDMFILNEIKDVLPEGHKLNYASKYDYRISVPHNASKYAWDNKTLKHYLRVYNLNCKAQYKRIPDEYKYNSAEIRKSILQGIFDTDGYIDSHGQLCIEVTSERLIDDIQEVIESFGGIVKRRIKLNNFYKDKNGNRVKCLPVYQAVIIIKNHWEYLRLPRKIDSCKVKKKPIHRNLKAIEYIGMKESACIKTSHHSGLYLTNNHIVTHNTFSHIYWLFREAHKGQPGWEYWWVAPVYSQAEIAFKRLSRKVAGSGAYIINLSKLSITTPVGTVITFKSAENPNHLYGENVHAFVFDEYSRAKEEAWFALRTTISYTRAKGKFIGNVVAKNWAWDLARKAEQGLDPDFEYFKITADDAVQAGILTQSEVDQARKDLPLRVFKMLYMAEFTEIEGALWTWDMIERNRVQELPNLLRVVIPVDPAVTSNAGSDETGIIPVGMGEDGSIYVIGDYSGKYTPAQMARRMVQAYEEKQANKVVGEVNNGGDFVKEVLMHVDSRIPFESVHAAHSKQTRAEPVAFLYSQGRIHHFGNYRQLEDQMISWVPNTGAKSPDRIDSLVWGVTKLLEGETETGLIFN